MCSGVLVAAAAGLLAGIAMLFVGRWLKLTSLRTWIAAGVCAALTGLVVADFSVQSAGGWWERHPTAGAVATGLSLLALTVLVVEAAVERVLAASEERRWRSAGAVAATAMLRDTIEPLEDLASLLSAVTSTGRLKKADQYPTSPPSGVTQLVLQTRRIPRKLELAVLTAAPVMTATDELHRLYNEALAAVEKVTDVQDAVWAWRLTLMSVGIRVYENPPDHYTWGGELPEDEWQQRLTETAQAWGSVMEAWTTALSRIRAFESDAVRILGIEPRPNTPWQRELS